MSPSTALAPCAPGSPETARAIEAALIQGDLRMLTPEQRMDYYRSVCESVGLNPLTQPFAYIILGGQLKLYCRKDATEQLRKMHNVTVEIASREIVNGVLIVHARATLPGKVKRCDEDFGAVAVTGLAGEALANAILRAVTKAKRRVTLSICGLGFLDETELPAGAIPFDEAQTGPAPPPAALPIPAPAVAGPVAAPDSASPVAASAPPTVVQAIPFPPKPVTAEQSGRIAQLELELGLSEQQIQARLIGLFGKVSVRDLFEDEAAKVITLMENRLAQVRKPSPAGVS